MAGQILVNTEQVDQIANEIESLNKQLRSELENSKELIMSLKNTWEGEAADETNKVYTKFAENYFNSYEEVITSYVNFLRNNVSRGYFETEKANVGLADAFI